MTAAPNPNIAARLVERAARHPSRPAIIAGRGRRRRVMTFGKLASDVARIGHRLRRRGLRPGDRALLFVPMSIDLYTTLLGVLHAGGVAVFLDAWAGRSRLEAAVEAAQPGLFVGTWKARLFRLVSPALRRVPLVEGVGAGGGGGDGASGVGGDDAAARVGVDEPALVTFTTGSTGRPKAAARSHGFLWAQHRVLARHLGLREDDIDMPTLPVFVLNNLALGVTTVLPDFDPRRPADIDPGAVLRQMRDERVTTTSGSPAFYARLVAHAAGRDETVPVRALFTGGAPVFPPLARALDAGVAGEAHVLYGSTEAEPIAGLTARELADATEAAGALGVCAGRPIPEIDVRIIRPVDGPVGAVGPEGGPSVLDAGGWAAWEAGAGEAGEIVVAGDHVLRGYLGDPAAESLNKVRDGDRVWHRTGDGGRLDGTGRLWLLGRVGQRVDRADGTGWPMAAEARALGVAGVSHAAYLGIGRSGGGGIDAGVAAVLCVEADRATGATGRRGAAWSADLEARLRKALGDIPVDEVRVIDRIPRDPRHASKTDVVALRRQLGGPAAQAD